MTVRELIKALLDQPLDVQAYVGKGMGPAEMLTLTSNFADGVVVISPGAE